jgi:tetratricopeptide (TPR) repeat protein
MELSKSDKKSFQLFFDLRAKKQYTKAISILKKLNQKIKNDSKISGLLGTAFYEMSNYASSRYYFKKTTILNEKSELASLGLFHSLCHLGKEILALKELDRFVTINKPVQYKITILGLKKSIKKSSNQKRNKMITKILLKVSKGEDQQRQKRTL